MMPFLVCVREKRCHSADGQNEIIKCNLSSRGLWLNSETFITNSNRWTRIIYNKINWAFTPLLASLSLDLV